MSSPGTRERFLAVIPARGGSKRIPRKNIRPFLGVPLLVRTIGLVRSTELFSRVIVSTDDEEIAETARSAGAEVPFIRPVDLSTDSVPTLPVITHAVRELGRDENLPDYVCCVYPGGVLAKADDIRQALLLLQDSDADYAFPVTSFPHPIQRAIRVGAGGVGEMLWPENASVRTQDLEHTYHDAGQFYWGRREAWAGDRPIVGTRSRVLVIPRFRVQDIDTPEDWAQAERLYLLHGEPRAAALARAADTAAPPAAKSKPTVTPGGKGVESQIVLGTVQFGLPYGRRRREQPMERPAVNRILDAAWERGIRAFDTADEYGSAPATLAAWLRDRGRLAETAIVTKLRLQRIRDSGAVHAACRPFHGAASLTILSHDAAGRPDWDVFRAHASAEAALVGQSIYTSDEVRSAAEMQVDRVQVPGNVLDFAQISAAHEWDLPVDVRSAYLQGLLLESPQAADDRVPGAGALAHLVQTAASEVGIAPHICLLAGVLAALRLGDRVVVGVDDESQLADIEASVKADHRSINEFLGLVNIACASTALRSQMLLDPRNWA